jgi:EAL and modified HD-GYP domain-containing signal transduction protein
MVGLFSVADPLVDRPLADIVDDLPLEADVANAILKGGGPLGQALDRVLAYERGDFEAALTPGSPDTKLVTNAYLEAIDWSTHLLAGVAG